MSDLIETWKNDFRAFVNSLNLSRDDYKTMMEYIDEIHAAQPDHVAGISKKAEGDCISRQAAIDAVIDEFKRSPTPAIRAKLRLEALPPAQPGQRWIPCSEGMPERADNVIICYKAGDYTLVSTGRYLYKFKMWYVDVVGDLRDGVTAWKPLPEPYRGGDA